MIPRGRVTAGAATLLFCGQYLLAEAIAAAAWPLPYSYSRNFISDLGITQCQGDGLCSPLGAVMNLGFILAGLLAVAAAWLLMPLMRSSLIRRVVVALAIVHATGSIIVGLVQSAPGTAAGTPHVHVIGAYGAVLGGNLALIAAGLGVSPEWSRRSFRFASLALGCFGLGCGLALVEIRGWPPGLLERGAVDTITLWEVVTGGLLAIRLTRHRPKRPVAPAV